MNSTTDAELVTRLNAGDASAFAALYERHKDWTFRIALRFCENSTDAAEIVQEVFLRWLRQFPGFQPRARLTTYLYAAARNIALDRRRRDKRLRFKADWSEPDQPTVRVPEAVGDSDTQSLRAALAKLPDGHREVLLMRIVDDMSVDEVAQSLGVAQGTVKSRLARALEQLRQLMADP